MIRGLFEETIQFQPIRRLPAQIAKRTPKCRVRSKVRIGTDSALPSNNPRHFLLFESRRFPFLQHVRNQGPDFGDYVVKTPELLLGAIARAGNGRASLGVPATAMAGFPLTLYGRICLLRVWSGTGWPRQSRHLPSALHDLLERLGHGRQPSCG